ACLAAITVLLGRGAPVLARAHALDDEAGVGLTGGLTVQDPPAGWPLSELRHQRSGPTWHAASTMWGAVQDVVEPEQAESRGSVRWYSATPAPPAVPRAAAAPDDDDDQQQMASHQANGWLQQQQHQQHQQQHHQQQPQQHVLTQLQHAQDGAHGPDPTISVGYSIGFAAGPDGGSGEHHATDFHRGTVQNEVVHGEGAVSYTNTLLPAGQDGQGHGQGGVVSSSVINGRPIYVPPLHQHQTFSAPAPPPGYQPLPTAQALVGGPQPGFNLVAATASPSPSPAGPVVVSTTPSYSTHTIFGSGSANSEFSLGPTQKPPKAASAVLHINDGTDFAWQDVGNGVEVSAPITPNGLRGGYRDSIPIMEDTDDAEPPAVPFEASTAAALHGGPGSAARHPPFGHAFVLGQSAAFDQTNAVFGESGRVESSAVPSSHVTDGPSSKPDPFRGFTSSSFIDFMRAYSTNTRQPHAGGGSSSSGSGHPPFPSLQGPGGDALLNTKLGQVYYIPSETPGGEPIPAVIMPLSRLRELQAALPSGKKPVYDLPPPPADGEPAFGKAPSFTDSPFKSSSFSDSPFKSSFDESVFKSPSFSDAPFKFADSPFKTSSQSDSPFKSSFGSGDHRGPGGPPPVKYRPSFGKGPSKEVFFKPHRPGAGPPHPHLSFKQQGVRFGPSGTGGVKITKSVPVYEEHQTLGKQPQHGQGQQQAQGSANEPSPALQWPPKETVEVQTYLMPIEQFDGLKSSAASLPPGHPGHHQGHQVHQGHHGPVRTQPLPPQHREVRRPAGHPGHLGHRPMRAHQPQPQGHHLPSQLESGAFAVTSSYRVRPAAG
ncbi:ATPase PAAT, partial [Frankliniella fusca]